MKTNNAPVKEDPAPWGTVRLAQKILDAQGYLVLGHNCDQGPPGSQFHDCYGVIFGIPSCELGPLMIVDFATSEDLAEQVYRFYPEQVDSWGPVSYKYYYKVKAE